MIVKVLDVMYRYQKTGSYYNSNPNAMVASVRIPSFSCQCLIKPHFTDHILAEETETEDPETQTTRRQSDGTDIQHRISRKFS